MSRGFSLVELLVCIAIIMLISTVILAKYKSFHSTMLLRNLAYEIALSTREAQVRGVSVSGDISSPSNQFNYAYGMHFTVGTTYTLFVDRDNDDRYDSDEGISTYTIGQPNRISGVCANASCTSDAGAVLDIRFERPNPDALFYTYPPVSAPINSVCVVVSAPDGTARTVWAWPTGQIAVKDGACT